jgi:hypothetical protein
MIANCELRAGGINQSSGEPGNDRSQARHAPALLSGVCHLSMTLPIKPHYVPEKSGACCANGQTVRNYPMQSIGNQPLYVGLVMGNALEIAFYRAKSMGVGGAGVRLTGFRRRSHKPGKLRFSLLC